MCLIIAGPAGKVRKTLLETPLLLGDIFTGNKDGIGSMHVSDDGQLVVRKVLPTTLAEASKFIEELPESDRDLALHFRMRTHGNIDLENCHPYPVVEGAMHLMHNGVIHHVDDTSDKTKSDTWHYIDQVIRPQIAAAPVLLSVPAWQKLIAEDIGSTNRMVMLDKDGRLVILNKRLGIEHDGMWFSNEYAWSPDILIPDYRGRWGYGYAWGDDEGQWSAWSRQHNLYPTGGTGVVQTAGRRALNEDKVWEAIHESDADAMYKLLDEFPVSTFTHLFKNDRFVSSVELSEMSQQDAKIVTMLEEGMQARLVQYCNKSAGRCRKVAEVVAWYGSWVSKEPPPQTDGLSTSQEPKVTLEVVDGQVQVVHEGSPDDADLETWRADFQEWLDRQQAGLQGEPRQAQPAKWTAQTPALLLPPPPPAQVAPIKSRVMYYRGYRIEVPVDVATSSRRVLQDYLEAQAQQLHDAALAQMKLPEDERDEIAAPPLVGEAVSEFVEPNEHYAG